MYYRGSRVSLSESQPRFYKKVEPRNWRERAVAGKPKEKKFRLALTRQKSVREDRHKSEDRVVHGFYRPNRLTSEVSSPSGLVAAWFPKIPGFGFSPQVGRWGGRALKIGLVVGLVGALVWSKVKTTDLLQQMSGLKLSKISVQGTRYLTEDQVIQAAQAPLGINMFKLDLGAISTKVGQLSWVKRVFVERRLPKALVISVEERKPVALLDNGAIYAVNQSGRILAPSEGLTGQDLPVVSGLPFPPDAVGTTQEAQALEPALNFLSFVKKKDASLSQDVSEVNVAETDCLKVTFINGMTALFNPTVTEDDLRHMALVLGDLNMKKKKAARLDFRYKDEVLVRTR